MNHIKKLLYFIKPYWRRSLVALFFLISVIAIDLTIPRLIQRIIDQGINGGNLQLVITTTIVMLIISLLQTLFALANNLFSVQVGRAWREIFAKRCSSRSSLSRLGISITSIPVS